MEKVEKLQKEVVFALDMIYNRRTLWMQKGYRLIPNS